MYHNQTSEQTESSLFMEVFKTAKRNAFAMSYFPGYFSPQFTKQRFEEQIAKMREVYSDEYVDGFLYHTSIINFF